MLKIIRKGDEVSCLVGHHDSTVNVEVIQIHLMIIPALFFTIINTFAVAPLLTQFQCQGWVDNADFAGCCLRRSDKNITSQHPRLAVFLIVLIVTWIGLILWHWSSERSGYIFWSMMLGLPLCLWGLLFNLRRYTYKVDIIAAEARNTEREKLIQYEVERGQRGAWILGAYVETALANSDRILLAAVTHSPSVISFSTPRGALKPVKYPALTQTG